MTKGLCKTVCPRILTPRTLFSVRGFLRRGKIPLKIRRILGANNKKGPRPQKGTRATNNRYPRFCQPLRAVITITLSGLLGHERGQRVDRLGLAPCGVYRAIAVAGYAAGSYPAISPLPLRAVYFLLHFPSSGDMAPPSRLFKRRTALWSPEVPPLEPEPARGGYLGCL